MNIELIARIRDFCNSRGIDVHGEAKYYDRKKSGMVPVIAFRRLLTDIGFQVSEKDFGLLCQQFETEKGVEIYKFTDAVENSANLHSLQVADTLSVFQEMKKLKRAIALRGTTIREMFEPYDPAFRGYVSENAFFRELGYSGETRKIAAKYTFDSNGISYAKLQRDLNELPSMSTKAKPDLTQVSRGVISQSFDIDGSIQQFDKFRTGHIRPEFFTSILHNFTNDPSPIVEFYTDCDGMCDTRQFINDLNMETKTITSIPKPEAKKVEMPDPSEVLCHMQKQLNMRHTDVRGFFEQLLNQPRVSEKTFMTIIEGMGLGLTNLDIQSLADSFSDGNNVDLQKFLSNFVKTPRRPADFDIAGLRDYLASTHQRITPMAERIDLEKTGEIDARQMHALLTRIGYSITQKELQGFVRLFRGKSNGTIQWEELAMAVDPVVEKPKPVEEAPKMEQRSQKMQRAPRIELKPEMFPIIQKINTIARRFSVNVEDELRSMDPRHYGFLSHRQICDSLSFADLTDGDRLAIRNQYPDGFYSDIIEDLSNPSCAPITETKRVINEDISQALSNLKGALADRSISIFDILDGKFIQATRAISLLGKYTKDAALIVKFFTDPRRVELVDVTALQRAIDVADAKRIPNKNKSDEVQISLDLSTMRQKAAARRRNISIVFNGCPDRINTEEFVKRLSVLNIIIDVKCSERIRAYFEDEKGINWSAFCTAVNNSRTI